MASNHLSDVLQQFRQTLIQTDMAGLTEKRLLECFINNKDNAALEAFIRRHSRMVWGVCRRILHNHHDAEDAFQATFLVFIRKAASIVPREMVANWLYGVAHQTALKARTRTALRKVRERQVTEMPDAEAVEKGSRPDLQPLLDQELSRLPDKYRVVILLCDLERKTRKEVAKQLGLAEGTVASRLSRARTMLAKRLGRQGLIVSGETLAVVLSDQAASACVPASVLSSTIKAGMVVASGQAVTAGVISAQVAVLTEGVMKAMLLTKPKTLAVLLVLGLSASTCVVWATGQGNRQDEKKANLQANHTLADKEQQTPSVKATTSRLQNMEALWNELASEDDIRACRAILAFAVRPRESTAFFKNRLRPVRVDSDRIKKLVAQLDDDEFARREAAMKELAKEVEYLGKFAKPVLEQCLKGKVSLEVRQRIKPLLERLQEPTKAEVANKLADNDDEGRLLQAEVRVLQAVLDRQLRQLAKLQLDLVRRAEARGNVLPLPRATSSAPNAGGKAKQSTSSPPNPLWLRTVRAEMILESFGTPEARNILKTLASGEAEALPTWEAKAALERLSKSNRP